MANPNGHPLGHMSVARRLDGEPDSVVSRVELTLLRWEREERWVGGRKVAAERFGGLVHWYQMHIDHAKVATTPNVVKPGLRRMATDAAGRLTLGSTLYHQSDAELTDEELAYCYDHWSER